jgi:hypothetical protein
MRRLFLCWAVVVGAGGVGELYGQSDRPLARADRPVIVRESPSTSANALATLPRGTIVIVQNVDKGWLRVGFLNSAKKYAIGWVPLDSVSLVNMPRNASTYGDDEAEVCNEATMRLSLTANVDSFRCRESIFASGYERCDIEVRYNIQGSCSPKSSVYKTINCTAELRTTDVEGFTTRRSADESKSVYLYTSSDSGSLEINAQVSSLFTPIARVRLEGVDCRLQ